jgi:O-antigen/teichoic acid export membrane protein
VEVTGQNSNQKITESLSTRVVKSGLWVFALRMLNRGLGFIRTIILARLLTPEDFGLLGIALLSISALETFSKTGFDSALIQKKENVESYLDTAWTVSALRGIVLFSILLFSAPLIARFFNSPEAALIIRVIALYTLLAGLRNIGIIFFQKELEFNKQFSYEFSATLVDLTVAITLAFILRNVWALVWGGLAARFLRLVLSYVLHPYRPGIKIDREGFQELFGFGKWVFTSGILVFLVTQGDDILLGKLLGVTALGLYQMAYTLANLPATEVTHMISKITFPAYSKFQEDLPRLREAYLKVLQFTTFVSFPLAGGIFVFASDFIRIFLGNKWMPMVPAVQVLVLAGLVRSIAATTGPIFHATGKPRIDTTWQIVRLLVLSAFIYPLTLRWGILGTATAVFLSIFVATIGFLVEATKIVDCDINQLVKLIILPLLKTAIVVSSVIVYYNYTDIINGFHLLLVAVLSLSYYLLLTYFVERTLNYGIYSLIKKTIAQV